MLSSAKLDLVRYAVARAAFQAVARTLGRQAIPVLPLKGVWLHACVYSPPEQRRTTDVDVLVPESRFLEARMQLRRHGWLDGGENSSEATLRHPAHELPLDLHRRLFTPGAFALPTDRVFARARPDRRHFGVEVWLPDPLDGLAHLIGHFVKSRGTGADRRHLRDFGEVGRAFGLDPQRCAAHLVETGLMRAARYALWCADAHAPAPFVAALLEALPPDPVGHHVARLAGRIAERAHPEGGLGALPGFMLDRSLPAGARALALRIADRKSDRRDCDRIEA